MKFTDKERADHILQIRNSNSYLTIVTKRWNRRNVQRERKVRLVGEGPYGETPVTREVRAGCIDEARSILQSCPEQINIPDRVGWTPLTECVFNTNGEMAAMLLEYGADIDWQGPEGMSLMHLVIDELYVDVEVSKKDEEEKRVKAMDFVQKKRIRWPVKTQIRQWETNEEKRAECLKVFKLFHDYGASFDMHDKKMRTPEKMLRERIECEEHRLMLEYYETGTAERNAVIERRRQKEEEEREKLMEEVLLEELLKLEKKLEKKERAEMAKQSNSVKKTRKARKARRGRKKKPQMKNQKTRGQLMEVEEKDEDEEEEEQDDEEMETDQMETGEEIVIEDGEVPMHWIEIVGAEDQMEANVASETPGRTGKETADEEALNDVDSEEDDENEQQTVSAGIVGGESDDDDFSNGPDEFSPESIAKMETESSSDGPELQSMEDLLDGSLDKDLATEDTFNKEAEQQEPPKEHLGAAEIAVNDNDVELSVTPGVQDSLQEVIEEREEVAPMVDHIDVEKEEQVNGTGSEEIPDVHPVEAREPVHQHIEANFLREELLEVHVDSMMEPMELLKGVALTSEAGSRIGSAQASPSSDEDVLLISPAKPIQTDVCTLTIQYPQAEPRTPGESARELKRRSDAEAYAEAKVRKTSSAYYDNPTAREKMIRQAQCVQTAKDQNPSTTLIIERTFQLGGGHTRNDMLSVADKAKKYSKCFGGTKTLPQADAPVITVSPEPEPVYSRTYTRPPVYGIPKKHPALICPVPSKKHFEDITKWASSKIPEGTSWNPAEDSTIWTRIVLSPEKIYSCGNDILKLLHEIAIEIKVPSYSEFNPLALCQMEDVQQIFLRILSTSSK